MFLLHSTSKATLRDARVYSLSNNYSLLYYHEKGTSALSHGIADLLLLTLSEYASIMSLPPSVHRGVVHGTVYESLEPSLIGYFDHSILSATSQQL
jgi:hypothetical protein